MEQIYNTKLITDYLEKTGISKTKFCKECRISAYTYSRVMAQNAHIGIKQLFRIARRLNIEFHKFFAVSDNDNK
jgi:transcriptional regulator with XRE-family HTH domain